jgi:hypothetical protein
MNRAIQLSSHLSPCGKAWFDFFSPGKNQGPVHRERAKAGDPERRAKLSAAFKGRVPPPRLNYHTSSRGGGLDNIDAQLVSESSPPAFAS